MYTQTNTRTPVTLPEKGGEGGEGGPCLLLVRAAVACHSAGDRCGTQALAATERDGAAVGDIRQGVPDQSAELEKDGHDYQNDSRWDGFGVVGEEESDRHPKEVGQRGCYSDTFEHLFALAPGAVEEERCCDGDGVSTRVPIRACV